MSWVDPSAWETVASARMTDFSEYQISAFRDAMAKEGLAYSGPIDADGRLHRFDVEGDTKGKRTGFYLLHLDDHTSGVFGDNKRFGCNKENGNEYKFHWTDKGSNRLTTEGRAELARRAKVWRAGEMRAALKRFDAAYSAYDQNGVLGSHTVPSEQARQAFRAAVGAVLEAAPRCPLELGRKVKVACTIGIHARIKRICPKPDPYAVNLYHHFWPQLSSIEPWFLASEVGYSYSIAFWEYGSHGGNFIVSGGTIDEFLEWAGPAWQAAIAADVTRLNAAEFGGGA